MSNSLFENLGGIAGITSIVDDVVEVFMANTAFCQCFK